MKYYEVLLIQALFSPFIYYNGNLIISDLPKLEAKYL